MTQPVGGHRPLDPREMQNEDAAVRFMPHWNVALDHEAATKGRMPEMLQSQLRSA